MRDECSRDWEKLTVAPDEVIKRIKPGMSIFLSTGGAEPRTLLKHLLNSNRPNLQDLEVIQVVSVGEAISLEVLDAHKYRLKTFFSGWVASDAVTSGLVDLIPSRFSQIPSLIESGLIHIDVAFVQITPPNEAGYSSLGVSVDVARRAMEHATLVVGEINPDIPRTYGDTFAPITDFDFLIKATEEPLYFARWPQDPTFDLVAENVASVIEDESCIPFSLGPLYESLSHHLSHKKGLGIHTPFITDALMDLIRSGAVTNRHKGIFRGRSTTSYAAGTKALMAWLHQNPMVEFQPVEKVWDPIQIGQNRRFVAILPARKVDLTGQIAMHVGKGSVSASPAEAADMVMGAEMAPEGRTLFALPSRNRKGMANIKVSIQDFPNLFSLRESVDMVVTEYGVANLKGRSVRERAMALIDIAHPEDRPLLVEEAKKANIIYKDQIFLADSARLYPAQVADTHVFKNNLKVRFRAIRPSDEEGMRRLFYRFSDEAVYYRYFTPIKAMPHSKMQEYVNVDYRKVMSIVGLIGEPGQGHLISEARFVKNTTTNFADVAFVVDEQYQGLGMASYMYRMLIELAQKEGIKGFTADVLASNKAMMKVFESCGLKIKARLESGAYSLTISFDKESAAA